MKFSLKWIKELVPFSWSLDELCERLTMAGVEVEGLQVQGQGLDNVIVAQILSSSQHPNADRLSVCEVETGSGKKQIVCGAKNYKVNDKIPLALSGAKLPNGMEIKRSKLRGVESDGMMCSSKELGLAQDAEGLLILSQDLKVGTPLTEALGLDDVILDLEITPNRPDLLSHWGLAREIAALSNIPGPKCSKLLSEDKVKTLGESATSSKDIPIRIDAAAQCPRYTGRIIRGVKVGPSPAWLRSRLEALGHRSISNVVDITNYVLEEVGQPLHAFDLKKLEGPAIIVRLASAGEKMLRLDEETSELRADTLVIADSKKPVAIAGVMGGMDTAVTETTTDILLESACFQPSSIRKTSKVLGISTDSSYRFERGVDVELAYWASLRATSLILEVCGAQATSDIGEGAPKPMAKADGGKVDGPLVDAGTQKQNVRKVSCRFSRTQSLLGTPISNQEIKEIFQRLGCKIVDEAADSCEVEVPSYRLDLEREIDLIEEVARVYGIGNIKGSVRPSPLSTTRDDASYIFTRRLRSIATSLGLDEASHYTLVSSTEAGASREELKLANPLTSEMDMLRPSLFYGLRDAAVRNLSGGAPGASLFEIGKIFEASAGKVEEYSSFAMILSGSTLDGASWEKGVQGKAFDFFDLKGSLENILSQFNLQATERKDATRENAPLLEPGMGFILLNKGKPVGCAGKINSALARTAKLPPHTFYAELDMTWLLAASASITRYKPWPVYPAIRRDIAMTVNRTEKFDHIEKTLQKLAKKHAESKGFFLQEVELFDIFQSEKIGEAKKSMAVSMTYRSPEKTLTDKEVNEVHDAVKKSLKTELECELRE